MNKDTDLSKEFDDIYSIDVPLPKQTPKKPINPSKPIKDSQVVSSNVASKTIAENNKDRRQERRKQTAEDFTPLSLVNEILDRLTIDSNNTVWAENKTFCDPACGNGNFLIEVLKRKLKLGHNPLTALKTIYGTDIQYDNIEECRLRLIRVIIRNFKSKLKDSVKLEICKIVRRNIKCTPFRNYPNGSLDYDFEFKDATSDKEAQEWFEKIRSEKLLEQVKID